jgi:hypothetical protein
MFTPEAPLVCPFDNQPCDGDCFVTNLCRNLLTCELCGNTAQGEIQLFTYAGEYTPRAECISLDRCFERSLARFKKNIPIAESSK